MNLNISKNLVLVAGACIFKEKKGSLKWFLVKQNDEDKWEIPKVLVRKGESSVRAALRTMGEKGNMTTRVLEEAGRFGGITTVNGRKLPQRHIYYLMLERSQSGEAIGFADSIWLDFSKTLKSLSSKREKAVLKAASMELSRIKKKGMKNKKKYIQNEGDEF
jgi:ADP-ribose pyrophosphatase YjhB (NUDIX family)